jgi:hypothetical protein
LHRSAAMAARMSFSCSCTILRIASSCCSRNRRGRERPDRNAWRSRWTSRSMAGLVRGDQWCPGAQGRGGVAGEKEASAGWRCPSALFRWTPIADAKPQLTGPHASSLSSTPGAGQEQLPYSCAVRLASTQSRAPIGPGAPT